MRQTSIRCGPIARAASLPSLASLALAGCVACTVELGAWPSVSAPEEVGDRRSPSAGPSLDATAEASQVRAGELTLLTWNLEWFQHPERGPADDGRQFEAVREALARAGASLVALQEVSDAARFDGLLERLPGYAGLLTRHEWPQQLALLYRVQELELVGSGVVLGLMDAGRPPLAAELVHRASGARLVVIVVHAKAGADHAAYVQREQFALGLADHLASIAPAPGRIVLGDLNDRLTASVLPGWSSPYAALRDVDLAMPTGVLESGAEASTVWGDTVDHILVDRAVGARLSAGAADVLRDELLGENPRFSHEVSDHFPVRLRIPDPRQWRARSEPR